VTCAVDVKSVACRPAACVVNIIIIACMQLTARSCPLAAHLTKAMTKSTYVAICDMGGSRNGAQIADSGLSDYVGHKFSWLSHQ